MARKIHAAKKSNHVPVVLTKEEVKIILDQLKNTNWLIAILLYGAGLRLQEALRLRVKDLDFNASFAGRLRYSHDSGFIGA